MIELLQSIDSWPRAIVAVVLICAVALVIYRFIKALLQ